MCAKMTWSVRKKIYIQRVPERPRLWMISIQRWRSLRSLRTNEYNDKVRQAIERMEKLAEMVNVRVRERDLPFYLITRPVIDAIRKARDVTLGGNRMTLCKEEVVFRKPMGAEVIAVRVEAMRNQRAEYSVSMLELKITEKKETMQEGIELSSRCCTLEVRGIKHVPEKILWTAVKFNKKPLVRIDVETIKEAERRFDRSLVVAVEAVHYV